MKLYKATNEQVPELSMEELLQMENTFLRDELEIASLEHDLELCQTVLKCIEEEGCVSKSIEVMFGESFTDVANAKNELGAQIESISNELLGKLAEKAKTEATFAQLEAMLNKLGKLKREDFADVKFPLEPNFNSRLVKCINAILVMGGTIESIGVNPRNITPSTIESLFDNFKATINVVSDELPKEGGKSVATIDDAESMIAGITKIRAAYRLINSFIKKNWVMLYRNAIPVLKESGLSKEQIDRLIAESWRVERIGVKLLMTTGRMILSLAKK